MDDTNGSLYIMRVHVVYLYVLYTKYSNSINHIMHLREWDILYPHWWLKTSTTITSNYKHLIYNYFFFVILVRKASSSKKRFIVIIIIITLCPKMSNVILAICKYCRTKEKESKDQFLKNENI